MGIYYVIANNTKREYFDPGDVGGGIKFSEFWDDAKTGPALLLLIRQRWYDDQVALVPDCGGAYEDVFGGIDGDQPPYTNIGVDVIEMLRREREEQDARTIILPSQFEQDALKEIGNSHTLYGAIDESLSNPDFENAGRVHDWRNYVPDCVKSHWHSLGREAKLVAILVAVQAADAEEWD